MSAVEPRRLRRPGRSRDSSSATTSGSCCSRGARTPSWRPRSPTSSGVDLGAVTLKTFSNGEVYCRYEESIRGADVFIVQPTCGNPATGITANDALMELLVHDRRRRRRLGAPGDRRHAVVRLLAARTRSPRPREPITARLVARMLEAAGADRVLTMDLHAGQIQGFFQKPVDHMTALFMLTQYFSDLGLERPRRRRAGRRPREAEQEVRLQDRRRAGDPRQGAPGPAGRRDRLRDRRRQGQDRGDRRRHDRHRRHAEGGGPDRARRGRRRASTPPRPTRSSPATPSRTSPARGFEEIVVTDTIPLRPGAPDNIRVLSCADLLTDSIRRIFTDDSVSEVFGGENQLF